MDLPATLDQKWKQIASRYCWDMDWPSPDTFVIAAGDRMLRIDRAANGKTIIVSRPNAEGKEVDRPTTKDGLIDTRLFYLEIVFIFESVLGERSSITISGGAMYKTASPDFIQTEEEWLEAQNLSNQRMVVDRQQRVQRADNSFRLYP